MPIKLDTTLDEVIKLLRGHIVLSVAKDLQNKGDLMGAKSVLDWMKENSL